MKRIFIDMDGTLARFHDEVQYLERMWEKNFFKNLKPFDNMVEATRKLLERGTAEIFILSAAIEGEPPYCKKEKHEWLDCFLPEIDDEHRIFTKVGVAKSAYISGGLTEQDYLIDDYNIGLEEWQKDGGTAIKCKNNINHKGLVGRLWEGKLIDNSLPVEQLVSDIERLCGIGVKTARRMRYGR